MSLCPSTEALEPLDRMPTDKEGISNWSNAETPSHGAMETFQHVVNEIKERVLNVDPSAQFHVHGSMVKGTAQRNRDVDMIVLVRQATEAKDLTDVLKSKARWHPRTCPGCVYLVETNNMSCDVLVTTSEPYFKEHKTETEATTAALHANSGRARDVARYLKMWKQLFDVSSRVDIASFLLERIAIAATNQQPTSETRTSIIAAFDIMSDKRTVRHVVGDRYFGRHKEEDWDRLVPLAKESMKRLKDAPR